MTDRIRFDDDDLVPCVMQDWATGEVLTLAYMNADALRLTRETGEVHFWSRSRGELWRKGESSGNVQRLRQLRYDCDADALVALVDPAGPACHTGNRSCFYRDLDGGEQPEPASCEALAELSRTLDARRAERPQGSYTVELLDDPERIGAKVREEADEVARAASGESNERVVEEAADVLYHLEVLMLAREANVIPVSYRFIDDCETPVSAFLKLREALPGPAFLLESAEQGRLGRYSFLGFRPRLELRWAGGILSETRDGDRADREAPDPYGEVAEILGAFEVAAPEGLPPFAGGAVGFFGYDLVRTVEPLGPPNPDPLGLPDMALMLCELMLSFDHQRHEVTVLGYAFCDSEDDVAAAYDRALALIDSARDALAGPVPPPPARPALEDVPTAPGSFEPDGVAGPWRSNLSREHFESNVARIIEYVHAGDAFQVVPSQRFTAPAPVEAFSIYRGLRTVNPSPYMYFL